ncbi:MAG: DNA topoisomerase VI subunit B, partial [Nanoarchaeota archaeon]|nr:DNA topoisomerase VI subunit B [Nanoarchaeota archaeon]
SVYRGNPFVVEVGIAYGGQQNAEGSMNLYRYANRVPLLYQQGACAVTKSVINTTWRNYGLSQSRGALPVGPVTLVVHIGSVWVPFTSESKEAIAHYPEIIKEAKLALQECGRKLGIYVNKKKRINAESQKRSYIEKYIPHVSAALKELLGLKQVDEAKVKTLLEQILETQRGKLEEIKIDNPEYDKEIAEVGKDEGEE